MYNYSSTKRHKDAHKLPINFLFDIKNMHSASAKKRKKSGKRSRCKDDSGGRVRSRDKVENKTLECNSAINTYHNSIARKDQSPTSFLFQDRMNFDDDEQIMQYMQDSVLLSNQLSNIEKSLKKQVKVIDSQKSKSENYDDESTKFSTEIEESKVNLFVRSLNDISNLHPSSCQLFTTIKEGIDDCLQRLLSREKFKDICLQDSLNKAKKELTKEQVEREALECQYFEMQERTKVTKKLDSEQRQLESHLSQLENDEKNYHDQISWLHSREDEIIKRLDLNEIDLVTERLDIYGVKKSHHSSSKKPRKYKVPKLNFAKLYEMQEQEDQEYESEEEEQEPEEDVMSSQKKYLNDGSAL